MIQEHISGIDLNLLLALDVLLEERSVTRSAARLGLTQSATSRTLGRLRALFRDPLFVRTSRGLAPTHRALELAAPVRQAMEQVERLLLEQAAFGPARAKRRFRVAAVDYAQVVVLAPLLARVASEAPGIDFELRQPSLESRRDLESGALDLLLAPQAPSGPGVVWTPLCRDGYTCVVWRRHRRRRLAPAAFAALDHVLVAPGERGGGIVDEVLAEHGLSRRVAVQVPTFLVLPHVLVGTQRIATVPIRMAGELARRHPLRVLAPPLPIPGFTLSQGWHEIHRHDPGHRWLRERVAEVARGLGATLGSGAAGDAVA